MPDTPARLATRGRIPVRLLGRAPGRRDLGHRAEPPGERQPAAERGEAERRPHPPRIWEKLEERTAHEPVAERAAGLGLDRLARRLDQLVVLDAGGAGGDARHAAEAAVEVPGHRRVERDRAVEVRLHQLDPAARRVHLLAPQQVGGAGRQAEAAVDAVARQRAEHVGCGGHASTPWGSKRARTRSWSSAHRPGVSSGTARREVARPRRRPNDGLGDVREERRAALRARTTRARAPPPAARATRPTPRRPPRHRRRATGVAATWPATAAAPPSNSTATRPGWRTSTALGTSCEREQRRHDGRGVAGLDDDGRGSDGSRVQAQADARR